MTRLYTSNYTIRLADTDAAGIVFFSRVYDYAHSCYEDFMRCEDMPLELILKQKQFLLPIIKSTAEYKKPLLLGQKITIELGLENITNSSYGLSYQFSDQQQTILARVKTVHVSISAATKNKIDLPEQLLAILTKEQ